MSVLLGCTGSVASIKVPAMAAALKDAGLQVRVVATESALHFFKQEDLPQGVALLRDSDEWRTWGSMGDPVLHIELRTQSDLLLLAPLDANTLAKVSQGLCDNLLTCVARCWDYKEKPVVLAPSMNTLMWQHPVTAPQLDTLRSWGAHVLPPVSKTLACGDTGVGAMHEWSDIVLFVKKALLIA